MQYRDIEIYTTIRVMFCLLLLKLCTICSDLNRIDDHEVWEEDGVEDDLEEGGVPVVNTADGSSFSLVLWVVHFITLLRKKYYIPDSAICLLLQFLSVLFTILGRYSSQFASVPKQFPGTLYQFNKFLGNVSQFKRYVVCDKCSNVQNYTNCLESVGTRKVPKLCSYRCFSQERPCGGTLLRQVELLGNRMVFYPLKVYCYMPLFNSLQILLARPNFNELCNDWKAKHTSDGVYRDVYDGKIWCDFQTFNDKPFLSQPYTFGLMLNIDWFKPCKHVEYSMGAMYLTIMNLPRRLRFRQENVILLPGPREPKHNINAFLQPFVHELLQFWHGVLMSVHAVQ